MAIDGHEFRDKDIVSQYSEDECPTDPWGDCLKLQCGGYNSEVTDNVVAVMERIRDDRPAYVTDIAAKTGLSESHVELIQYILCSAELCEYGTSPRGCWPIDDARYDTALRLVRDGNPALEDD